MIAHLSRCPISPLTLFVLVSLAPPLTAADFKPLVPHASVPAV